MELDTALMDVQFFCILVPTESAVVAPETEAEIWHQMERKSGVNSYRATAAISLMIMLSGCEAVPMLIMDAPALISMASKLAKSKTRVSTPPQTNSADASGLTDYERWIAAAHRRVESGKKPHDQSPNEAQHQREEEKRRIADLKRRQGDRRRAGKANQEKVPDAPITLKIGSGFFVSKLGHIVTNEHAVGGCSRVTVGDSSKRQIKAAVLETDKRNDLALLQILSLDSASAETKTLVKKLGLQVLPLAGNGMLRDGEVILGETVMVAGYPFGDIFSDTIKVTRGIVSADRGVGDNSSRFQIDAAVQTGNSGGPIYDESGNVIGVVVAQLDKLKMAKAIGTLPENSNFGIKASTVRQFLVTAGLPTKSSNRSKPISSRQIAEIGKNQTVMVMCYQ